MIKIGQFLMVLIEHLV